MYPKYELKFNAFKLLNLEALSTVKNVFHLLF